MPGFDRLSLVLAGALLLGGAAGCKSHHSQSATSAYPHATGYGNAPIESPFPPPAPGSSGPLLDNPDDRSARRSAPTYDDDVYSERQFPPGKPVVPPRKTTLGRKPSAPVFPDDEADAANQDTSASWKHSPFAALKQKFADRGRRSNATDQNRSGSVLANRRDTGDFSSGNRTVSAEPLVGLAPPADLNPSDHSAQASLRLPIDDRRDATPPPESSAVASRDSDRQPRTPAVPDRSTAANDRIPAPDARSLALNRLPTESFPGREPVRMVNPPLLHSPPIDGGIDGRSEGDKELAIPQIRICQQVRGFEDVVLLDAARLRQGQPILIYATLENFHSMATPKGYRTLTLSTLEVQTADGGVLQRQPLGPAVDLADVPRRDFFLTHLVTIPEDLPPGDYFFNLCVDDLLKHGSAHARIAVRITEDRTPRDEMADTSKSATRRASYLK